MIRPASILHSPFSILLLLAPSPAAADLTVLRDVRREIVTFADRPLKFGGVEQVRIQPGKVRFFDVTLGQVLVVRLDQKKILHLDLLRSTAAELTFDQLAARRAAALEGVRGARALVLDTPEAARLDGVLRGFGVFPDRPPAVERRATGEKAAIAGRETSRVQIVVDGETRCDLWMAEELEEGSWYAEALAALQAVPAEVAGPLRQGKGFPLRADLRLSLFLDRVRIRAEARSVDTGPIPAAEFEAPGGFKQVPFSLLPEETGQEIPPPPAADGK